MKINKETRQLRRNSFARAYRRPARQRPGRVLVKCDRKEPRHYIQVLEAYQRLLRLEVEKRTATIETASELPPDAAAQIVANLKRKYGSELAARFVVNPELLGGMRIRVGSDVWDSSVRNRLHRLQQQL